MQDRDGGLALLATLFGLFPFLERLFADSAYEGPIFRIALAGILPHLQTEIVKRSDQIKGFVALPKRWIAERTIAWLNRCRRLAKDFEETIASAEAWVMLASIRVLSLGPGSLSYRVWTALGYPVRMTKHSRLFASEGGHA